MKSSSQDRETKMFWAVNNSDVVRVKGYSCKPWNDYWWCPEVGYSMQEGLHLFDEESKALDVAISEVEKEFQVLSSKHAKLIKRRKSL